MKHIFCLVTAFAVSALSIEQSPAAPPSESLPIDMGLERVIRLERADGTVDLLSDMVVRAARDFDNDSRTDLLLANDGGSIVALGVGPGEFREVSTVDGVVSRTILVTADFDRDSHLDVLSLEYEGGSVIYVFAGLGDGRFAAPRRFEVGGVGQRLHVEDLDEDGFPDVLIQSMYGMLVLLNDRGRGFGPGAPVAPEGGYEAHALGDLNGDGIPDLVRATRIPDHRGEVLLGDGRGGFETPRVFEIPETRWNTREMYVFDFDADGLEDVVRVTVEGLDVHLGDGGGGIRRDRHFPAPNPLLLDVADFDRDGAIDIGMLLGSSGSYRLYLGDGSGGYRLQERTPFRRFPRICDVDLDGVDDLLFQSSYLRGGRAGLAAPIDHRISAIRENAEQLFTGDFNGDGVVDLGGLDLDTLWIRLGQESGQFEPRSDLGKAEGVRQLCVGHFDDDGHLDVAILRSFFNRDVSVFHGDGAGGFEAEMLVARKSGPGNSIVAADLDSDGVLEVFFNDSAAIEVFRKRPDDRRYESAHRLVTGVSGLPAVFDANGDGINDVAYTQGRKISIHLGRRNGTIDERSSQDVPTNVRADVTTPLVSFNYDGDEYTDVAIIDTENSSVVIVPGDRSDPVSVPAAPRNGHALQAARLTASDREDLLVLTLCSTMVISYAGVDRGPRVEWLVEGCVGYEGQPGVQDMDGDGHVDLVVRGSIGSEPAVAILWNRTFDSVDCRAGTVDAGSGRAADVLFVNGSAGEGQRRELVVRPDQALQVRMTAPPSAAGPTPFVLYAWHGHPDTRSVIPLPQSIGRLCMPIAWSGAARQPAVIWNNVGFAERLGDATKPSSPAPTTVMSRPWLPFGFGADLFLQGVIADARSASGSFSVTNGIAVSVRP